MHTNLWLEATISLLAGILILLKPKRFYLIAAGYLFVRALVELPYLNLPIVIAAAVCSILIAFLPKFLAYLFGVFLIATAILTAFQFGFGIEVSIALVAGALLFFLPDMVAWIIGLYLLLHGSLIFMPKLMGFWR